MEKRYLRLFEEFIDADYDMQQILNDLLRRSKSWFEVKNVEGEEEEVGILSKNGATLVDITPSTTSVAMRKSIIVNFKDNEYYYQLILRTNIEKMSECDVILKKYSLDSYQSGDLEMIDQISLTGEDRVEVNEVKGRFILDKIADLNKESENPDDREIKVPKEEEETPPEETPPAQGGEESPPPAQGGGELPPAQGGVQGMPPPTQGAPPAL